MPSFVKAIFYQDCGSNPCQNGWCEETMEGYECHCPDEFQGKHCDEPDTTPPNVTCPDDVFKTVELGTLKVPINFTEPSATEISGNATLFFRNYSSGDEFPIGSTLVEYVFSDGSGNQASCNFTVVVNTIDTTPPDVTCPDDFIKTIELGPLKVFVNFTQPSASDISGNATLVSGNHSSGDDFPVGSTLVEYVFSDGSGNQALCNFTVVVNTIDTTPPDVTCPDDFIKTIELGPLKVSVNFTQPSACDISGNATLVSGNHGSGDDFLVGSTLVEYVFSDGSGNQALCNFTVVVNTIVRCPGDINITTELGTLKLNVNFTEPSATDMGNVTLVSGSHNSGDEFPVGSTFVEYVFSDGSGNQASCNFSVVVSTIDTTPPDVTCPDDVFKTIELGTPKVPINFTEPSASDISGNATLVSRNYSPGDKFPVGSTLVEYAFSDGSRNQASCNFTVVVNANMSGDFDYPLGLENGFIPDSSLKASSSSHTISNGIHYRCPPQRVRLSTVSKELGNGTILCGAWKPANHNKNQWIQVDLSTLFRVRGVATQNNYGANQWVTSYKIKCSRDGVHFDTLQDISKNQDKVFQGNSDRNTVVKNAFPEATVCRFIRLLPISWNDRIALRMELYGDHPIMCEK
ncbi:hyalin-like [Lytechinus pictus]|uniref:hyalin-like n=1 Tax=Lytechinus pictus TaxID=7653 RepID=UPI0030BA0F73